MRGRWCAAPFSLGVLMRRPGSRRKGYFRLALIFSMPAAVQTSSFSPGLLMPARKDQSPPDLRYFKKTQN
jgi:hypothetical protein